MTAKKRDIDSAALFTAMNDLEAETGQTTALVQIARGLLSEALAANEADQARALIEAIEHQQERVDAAHQTAWNAYFGRTGTDAPAADPAPAQAAH